MLTVSTYAPKIKVTVWPALTGKPIILTGGMGGADVVLNAAVDNAIGQPVGRFDIQCAASSRPIQALLEPIQPNDYVEIEMARTPSSGGNLTMVMRGFLDNKTRSIGVPSQRISLSGRNFGKLTAKFKVYYLSEINPASSLVPNGRLEQNFNIPAGVLSMRQFLDLINTQIITPNLRLLQQNRTRMPNLKVRCTIPDQFAVNGFSIQPFTGAVWGLLQQYLSAPWIETIVYDDIDAPTLIARFAPYKDYSGLPISDFVTLPTTHQIQFSDIISLTDSLSDNEVYTYFFTYPTYSYLNRDNFKAEGIALGENPIIASDADLARYGFNPLETETTLIPSLVGETPDQSATARPETIAQAARLNRWLFDAFKDNHRFTSGTLTVKGGAEFQPGHYVQCSDLGWEWYIQGVNSRYSVESPQFETTLAVNRGRPLVRAGASGGGGGLPAEAQ